MEKLKDFQNFENHTEIQIFKKNLIFSRNGQLKANKLVA